MGRFWLGIGLLLFFLGLGLWVARSTIQTCDTIAQTLTQAAETSLSGNLEEGKALALTAHRTWDAKWHGVASVADHSPMDEIDGLFGQLFVYGQGELPVEFAACCARLSRLICAVGEAHSLTWWNLL